MRPTEKKIEQYIKNTKVKTNPEVNQAVLNDLLDHLETAAPAQTTAPQPKIWRTIMQNRIRLSSAAAAVLIAALVGISQLVFVTPTFAEIVEPILRAHTIAFEMIVGDSEDTSPVIRDRIKGPRIRRTLSNMPNIVQIIDTENSKMLTLADEYGTKTATYVDIAGPIGEGTRFFHKFLRDTLGHLKNHPDFEPIRLDKQSIDGREVIGYAATDETVDIKIWADAKTSLPVRMEIQVGPQFYIIKNFQINLPVDDAEISMDVPEGYTLNEVPFDLSEINEEHLVESLRFWATVLLDGTFPDALTTEAYVSQMPLLESKLAPLTDIPDDQKQAMAFNFIRGMIFLQLFEMKLMEPWHYAGQGVAFGDRETPIFWYRPKDGPNYRVIYGDLSIVETLPEDLPQ